MRLVDADELLKGKSDHEMISTHLIFNAPTVDAKPVVKGVWLESDSGVSRLLVCSQCGEVVCCRGNFCPNCGADMRGKKNV